MAQPQPSCASRRGSRKPAALIARHALVRSTWVCEVPDGWPTQQGEVLVEVSVPHTGVTPSIIEALWFPGCGYSHHISIFDPATPERRLSEPAKQNLRRKALVRRVNAKAPLFASELIEQSFASKPEYFGELPGR